jgi:hypothetical protein
MTKVSVIVPVYNTEVYLEKCLDSLVNQTLKDIEIIVVNDGSCDNSQNIIDKYSKKYKKIKPFIKKNGGLSDARNFGLKKAQGDYIAFVDSDDYVDVNMYQVMYDKAMSGNFDMVVCDFNLVYDDKVIGGSSNIKSDTNNIKSVMNNIYPAAWNKLFNKKLFENNVFFKKGVWFEDVEFIYRLIPYIKSIGVVNNEFYQYIQRSGSISKTFDKRLYNYIDNWNGIIDFYKDNGLYDDYFKELEFSYVRYLYATFVKQATNFDYDNYKKALKDAIYNVKLNFPKYRKNKYFYKGLKGYYLLMFNEKIGKLYYKYRKSGK